MTKRRVCILLLLPLLFSGFSWGLWAQESWEAGNPLNSENALNRLIGISEQLSTLNERLRSELQDSRRSSRELQTTLESSKQELNGLKHELETLRNSSTELLIKAENSQTESAALQTALRKAESSLTNLELSFEVYRQAAENRISGLERQNRLWKWGCIGAGILAAGFGTALLVRGP